MSRLRIVYDRNGDHLARYEDGILVWSKEGFGESMRSGIQIVPDIEPYKAVATDIATGDAPVITSRSKHREFLKRNGYEEVGNEMPKTREAEFTASREMKQELAARYYDALHRSKR